MLGGVPALLPIFARDVLDTGPWGLGLLRSAPAVGALTNRSYKPLGAAGYVVAVVQTTAS